MKPITPEIGSNMLFAVMWVCLFFITCAVVVWFTFYHHQQTKRMQACVEVRMEWNGYCLHPEEAEQMRDDD